MPESLHFTIVSTQREWHGGEAQAALLARGLRARGDRCSLLARRDGEFARRMVLEGFPLRTFRGRGRGPWPVWRMRRDLRDLAPDVLYFNDPHAVSSAGAAAWGLPIPVRLAARRVDFPLRWAAKYLSLTNGVICVSRAVVEACTRSGLPASFLHLVPDGVDPAFAASGVRARGRANLGVETDQRLLMVVAKLTDHKGHRYLLEALPAILGRFPRVVLALAGDGELRHELAALCHALGIASQVRWLGYRSDVPDLLAAADLIVQPSHLEGLCSSLIDAMLAERPIVATRAGGIPDLLDATEDGEPIAWLAEVRPADSLALQIIDALSRPRLCQVRGQLARRRALRLFTADQMVARTVAVCGARLAAQPLLGHHG